MLMNGEGMKDLIEGDYPWAMPRTSDEAMTRQILERMQGLLGRLLSIRTSPSGGVEI